MAEGGHLPSLPRRSLLRRWSLWLRAFRRNLSLVPSASVRFAMLYAGLFAISALALAVFLWWTTAGLLNRQTETAILTDAQGLAERWNDGGLPALVQGIQERLSENLDDDAIYLLTDPEQRRIAGNLAHWPSQMNTTNTWFELSIQRAGTKSLARIRRFDLPSGFHLLIGRDVQARARLRDLLTGSLVWAMVVVVALSIAGALVVRGLFRRSLADISSVAAAIGAGNLTRRVKLSGRGDEFDRLAETVNDMLDRIGRLMEGVKQVSNAIAHDLRTPIARVRARLEDALTYSEEDTKLAAAVERAIADLDGVTAIFQGLLRIAEIESGARRSAFATTDLQPILADLCELYEPLAEEKNLLFVFDCPNPLPIFGDRSLLQQALANMLDNAIKFLPTGGTLHLSGWRNGADIFALVADNGPGIPEADRNRATERFFRGETARSTPGSGLGLALVQAVAQLHGGVLRLEDNNPGLRAVLILHAAAPKTLSDGEEADKSTIHLQLGKI
ncbi:Two component system histidine kinase [Granulibacter bethesdensis]|nr:Two component system histidine kinase [Granulibacter bethesdensis]